MLTLLIFFPLYFIFIYKKKLLKIIINKVKNYKFFHIFTIFITMKQELKNYYIILIF